MTHDELLASIIDYWQNGPIDYGQIDLSKALRAVVELHKCSNPRFDLLCDCGKAYPCLTIQAIEAELK